MKRKWYLLIVGLILGAIAFAQPSYAQTVDITLLQFNDVYEITASGGGTIGGLARVATVRKQLLERNPHTYTILAGDCFSPSALGTAQVNGKRLAGKQMVAVLNAMGLQYATFGNHEFDIQEEEFYQRLKESRFKWISSNVFDVNGKPFPGVPLYEIITVKDNKHTPIKIGLIGVTIDSNPANYVTYKDAIAAAKEQVDILKNRVDIIVAVTHLSIDRDRELAETVPEIDLILGGHEHENIQQWRGLDFTPLFKADSNVRTVYIHNLHYNPKTRHLEVESRLRAIADSIPEDPETANIVDKWLEIGFNGFRANGFSPEQVVSEIALPLDGLEASVRNHSTALTDLIAKAMLHEVPDAELAIFNGGMIRIDDIIQPGDLSQYDIIRILPFGGKVLDVAIAGPLLKRILNQGMANKGSGGYLQTANVSLSSDGSTWLIQGTALDPTKTYRVAISDFLVSGKETGLSYLTLDNPGVQKMGEKRDVRFALIDQLQKNERS